MKVKQYWEFIKWHCRNWTPGQRWWMAACGLFGASLGEPDKTISLYLLMGGIVICFGLFLKYVVFEIIASEYQKFKKERTDLFKTIDEGKQ